MTTTAFDFFPLLLPAVFGLPLALAIGLPIRRWQPVIIHLAPWSAVPALTALAWIAPNEGVEMPWLFLELNLALDSTGRIFLFFTSVLWLLAGIYAQSYLANNPKRKRFFFFYLLSMSGNLGLIISHDVVSFYVFFALMSFASYGLVVHNGDSEALNAGRIYMILVVVGEVMLFTALVWQAGKVGSILLKDFSSIPPNGIVVGLILIGFGIKVGALPVHVWLPLAHPAAPTPASAVLSGAMIKAGLLGWLRFLPIGQLAMPQWGTLCIIAGLLAAYYAVAVGLTQGNPKAVLAYSSISQMGLMTIGVGLAIGWPQTVSTAIPAILIYSSHHALAKGALFLGVGVIGATEDRRSARRLAAAGMIFASLALAGAPLTSGAVAKIALKIPLKAIQDSWLSGLNLLLPLAAVGTTLLMSRLMFIVTVHAPNHGKPRFGMWLSWTLTILLTAAAVWLMPAARKAVSDTLQLISLWNALWPVAAAVLISVIVWLKATRNEWSMDHKIPQGDILSAFSYMVHLVFEIGSVQTQRIRRILSSTLTNLRGERPPVGIIREWTIRLESRLTDWQTACLIFVLLTGCLFVWALD
ncbi:MAG: NADH-ubiquinone oxidoreductase [Deltaproteobacteria bacterium]|jgi:formate hydrogenlyase subunit 3/multisubunit Na+/H+ antiporter MnhD subunit|nr:NADH-ubiquinone oxidoreductase [Deltaproteobacteria bacterium]